MDTSFIEDTPHPLSDVYNASALDLVFQLESTKNGPGKCGLTEEELKFILCRCSGCNRIMTKLLFRSHHIKRCPSLLE